MDTEKQERLRREAEFQDARTEAAEAGAAEARSRFYYLMDNANTYYESTLFDTDQTGNDILVVGCSTGSVTPLARLGANVVGVDISPASIRVLNRAIEEEGLSDRASAVVMDAEELTLEDQTIDTVCCSGVLHHLDVERSAKSWARVLRPTGRVRMLEPMALNPLIALYRHFTPGMRTEDEHPLKPKDIKILKKYYQEVEVQGFVLTSLASMVWAFLPNVFNLRGKTYAALEKVDRGLLKVFPFLVYFCWAAVIEARKPIAANT